jgi:ribosomal protein S18 acetylase RimI-like enzyme
VPSQHDFVVTAEIAIRRCREGDLPRLEWFGLFTEHRELIQNAFRRQQTGEVVMLVADLDGFPVGQLWLDLTGKQDEEVGVLWALRVFPFLQNRSIGRRLIGAGEQELEDRDYRWAEIGVDKSEARAESLYRRLGYEPSSIALEEYSYRNPAGALICVPVELDLFRKRLTSGASRAFPRSDWRD